MMRRALTFAVLLLVVGPAWSEIPVGAELTVNTYTTADQNRPSVATDADGNFVVVWTSAGQDQSGDGVFARRFDAAGTPLGAQEFRVNAYTTGYQALARVALDAAGRMIVVWTSDGQDGSWTGVFGRRFDASGTAGPEFPVNSYTTITQRAPDVATDPAGNFVVVWESNRDGFGYGVFAQRYDAAGAPQGTEFQVNTYTTGFQSAPRIAMNSDGSFVVVWESSAQDGDTWGIRGRRYDASGLPAASEFQVNTYTTGTQRLPSVAMDPDGRFMVAWQGAGAHDGVDAIIARRYDAGGSAEGPDIAVNVHTTGQQLAADVTADETGHFVVAWMGPGRDGSSYAALGRRFTPGGDPGQEFWMNAFTTGSQGFPTLAAQGGQHFFAAWTSTPGQDGNMAGVFGRRMLGDAIFDDGFETGTLASWSGGNTDGSDLAASTFGAMKSTGVGLQAVVDDTAALYVQDDTPDDEERYRARFYFDPNGFDPGEAQQHFRTRIFIAFEENPTRRLLAVVLRRQGGEYALRARLRKADGTQIDSPFVAISDAPHFIEIDWKRGAGAGAASGWLQMSIEGPAGTFMFHQEDNPHRVDFVRMGALSVKSGASGTLYFDEFESRRLTAIGP
jgi:hypothetical protein